MGKFVQVDSGNILTTHLIIERIIKNRLVDFDEFQIQQVLMCIDRFQYFSAIFTKGNKFHDFLFASLEALPKGNLFLKKIMCSY